MSSVRCTIEVDGLVQGVGFRPFVHGLAGRFGLGGFVRNGGGGVHIEVEGKPSAITRFVGELKSRAPAPAQVGKVVCRPASVRGEPEFRIEASATGEQGRAVVPPDLATCADCVRELFDVADRRARHPFVNCTNCGPRASILADLPYDRERTSMAAFPLCAECAREYATVQDRRFHAEPIACPACGPRLRLVGTRGEVLSGDPIERFAEAIALGRIGALKGIGGFHLVCDATNERAVAELRLRKHRDRKPFAVMVADVPSAEQLGVFGDESRDALSSPARPIVLVKKRQAASVAPSVAPGIGTIGVLLPYTPVHHLLLRKVERPLVVTSGNVAEEPIASTDQEAFAQLSSIADLFLTNDRAIRLKMEDSVVRATGRATIPIRRSRGHAPLPVELPFFVGAPTLALGGHEKSVFCLGFDRTAVQSPHFGDLTSLSAYSAFTGATRHFESLFRVRAERLVHDLHPDYATTRFALECAKNQTGIECIAVGHHHAHLASAMAENGLSGDVLGVCFDGTGLGPDGNLWGGEFLVGGYASVERAAHLAEVDLPGGDRAAREPWRSALAHLVTAGLEGRARELLPQVSASDRSAATKLIERGVACKKTSSMGRLFDAASALVGVAPETAYEGEAAMRLEALADRSNDRGAYPVRIRDAGERAPLTVDPAPLLFDVVSDVGRGVAKDAIARRFHSGIVEMIGAVCRLLGDRYGLERVVLTGGVFQNAILASETPRYLANLGFRVFTHRVVPPNDGGLALGQLAVAAHRGASVETAI